MPELHIITGSNGAGKSTVGSNYLPLHIQQSCTIFDGDKLFMNKQTDLWRSGVRAIKEAKKIAFAHVVETFDHLVETALNNQNNFVYEGHFTNEATWDIPKRFKLSGYSVHMIFFGLTDTNLSELRVVARKQEGGHYVDPFTVASNFYGNLEKLNLHFQLFNSLQIVDTSEIEHKFLAVINNGHVLSSVALSELPVWFSTNLPAITQLIQVKENG